MSSTLSACAATCCSAFVRLVDDCLDHVFSQIRIRLYQIDTGVEQFDRRLTGTLSRIDVDGVVALLAFRRFAEVDPRAGNEPTGAGEVAAVDRVANVKVCFEKSADLTGGRHSGHQEMLLHRPDELLETDLRNRMPLVVRAGADDVAMGVHIDQTGEDCLAASVNDDRTSGHWKVVSRPYRLDRLAFDEDDGVMDRPTSMAVDEHSPDDCGHGAAG